MTGVGGIDDIHWVRADRAAFLPSVWIPRDTRPVGVYWVAAAVCPDRRVDADGIAGVELGRRPLGYNLVTVFVVIVGPFRVAD
jgi:hypothetical protein